jgi:hypothetical protein
VEVNVEEGLTVIVAGDSRGTAANPTALWEL